MSSSPYTAAGSPGLSQVILPVRTGFSSSPPGGLFRTIQPYSPIISISAVALSAETIQGEESALDRKGPGEA